MDLHLDVEELTRLSRQLHRRHDDLVPTARLTMPDTGSSAAATAILLATAQRRVGALAGELELLGSAVACFRFQMMCVDDAAASTLLGLGAR